MENNLRKAYSEIYEILNLMEPKYIDEIPDKIKDLIKNEKDNAYKINISANIPLEKQELQEDTLTILSLLYLNYWCEDEKEKQELIRSFNEVDKKNAEKYSVDNLFKKPKKDEKLKEEHITEKIEENSLVKYKGSFFKRMINKIKELFKRKSK